MGEVLTDDEDSFNAAADSAQAQNAYDRADAWARSLEGTPYGSTTPTLSKENSNGH
jgi:hypothetical protein